MSEKLGTLSYAIDEGYQKSFSNKTSKLIDEEVKSIIDGCYNRCKEVLLEKRDLIEKLAEALLKKETLTLPDILEIMGPRPYPLKETIAKYLEELKERQEVDE